MKPSSSLVMETDMDVIVQVVGNAKLNADAILIIVGVGRAQQFR